MIWDSIAAMTLLDLAVIAAVSVAILAVRRPRRGSPRAGAAAWLIPGGLALIGGFYLTDLASMHLLPLIVGQAAADGAMRWLHLEAIWLVNLGAVGMISIGLVRETAQRRRNLRQLEDSEARYRSIVDDQSDMIVRWQPGGIRTWVNEPYRRAFGGSEELIGTSFFPQIDESDRDRIVASLAELGPDAPSRSGQHRVVLANGESRWQEWTDSAIFDDAGEIIEIQSVGRDITDRVATAEALARSETRFRSLVESTSDWVWEMDLDGRHSYSNSRIEEILGYTPAELRGMHWHALVHPDDLHSLNRRFESLREKRQGWQQWILRTRHRNGNYRYLESSAVPVLDAAGELLGYRGIDRDVTFSALMAKTSSSLMGARAAELAWRIPQAFAEIGAAYGIEKISLWSLDETHARRRYQWHVSHVHGDVRPSLQPGAVPFMTQCLRSGSELCLASLDELPDDVPDREVLAALGVRATLEIPFFEDGELIGIVAFLMFTSERSWPDEIRSELRHLAEKIIAAHAKAEAAERVERNERDLSQSEALAEVGSFAYYPMGPDAEFPEEWTGRFSEQLLAALELKAEESTFGKFMERVHADDRQQIMDATARLFEGSPEVELSFRTIGPSGKLRHFSNRTRMDRDEQGRNLRIIGANRDITEQVLREQELNDALGELAELKDDLAVENKRLRQEVRSIRGFERIVGECESLRRCLDLAARAGPTEVPVLIQGETGTGKELIAKAIHRLSPRSDYRMVSLNCATLPPELVESELFGHEKGAFTGAVTRRKGRFELADGGTLFLDEVGELPLQAQSKLLRVLEDGSFERVGGTQTIRVDVRIVTATNRDLQSRIETGEFRSDLYFRINTVTVNLPPLRERKADIPLLAQHFIAKHGPRLNKGVEAISTGLLRQMQRRDWPGNVRELENFIERCLITAEGPVLTIQGSNETEPERAAIPVSGESAEHRIRPGEPGEDLAAVIASVEKEHIENVLATTQWVVDGANGAASRLGLPPSTLRYKMKKLGIERRH